MTSDGLLRIGLLLGGKRGIKDSEVAGELKVCTRNARRFRNKLWSLGLIVQRRTAYGCLMGVTNSQTFPDMKPGVAPEWTELAVLDSRDVLWRSDRSGHEIGQKWPVEWTELAQTNKTLQESTKNLQSTPLPPSRGGTDNLTAVVGLTEETSDWARPKDSLDGLSVVGLPKGNRPGWFGIWDGIYKRLPPSVEIDVVCEETRNWCETNGLAIPREIVLATTTTEQGEQ